MEPTLHRYLSSLRAAGVRRVPRGRAASAPVAAPVAATESTSATASATATPAPPGASPAAPSAKPGASTETAAQAASEAAPRTEGSSDALIDGFDRLFSDAAQRPVRPADPEALLEAVAAEVRACTACGLCEKRQNAVPGEGSPRPDVVFVGEGPGADEDATGRPFVGRAGELLDAIITRGMKRRREDVFIANIVKCRPPGNRAPTPDEAGACRDHLERQLAALAPKVICVLGNTAAHNLLGTERPMSRLRGGEFSWRGIPVVPTYHPAYLLRSPEAKKLTWEDIQRVMEIADAPADAS